MIHKLLALAVNKGELEYDIIDKKTPIDNLFF